MTQALDPLSFNVDFVSCNRFTVTVVDLATGIEHVLAYDGLAIGANESGAGYTLIIDRSIAAIRGLTDVQ